MSRGLKGSEVIASPQPAQIQLPSILCFSPGVTGTASRPSSSGSCSPAKSASSGMSYGASADIDISVGADSSSELSSLLLLPPPPLLDPFDLP